MTHKLATDENFDIVRGNQTVRVPFAATDPASATTTTLATGDAIDSAIETKVDQIYVKRIDGCTRGVISGRLAFRDLERRIAFGFLNGKLFAQKDGEFLPVRYDTFDDYVVVTVDGEDIVYTCNFSSVVAEIEKIDEKRAKSDLAVYDANGNPEAYKSLAVLDNDGMLTMEPGKKITFKTSGTWAELNADNVAAVQRLHGLFANETISANPTQNEMAEAVKKIFVALGGTVQSGN